MKPLQAAVMLALSPILISNASADTPIEATQGSATSKSPDGILDPAIVGTLKQGTTTSDEVKQKLGPPVHEDHNKDGRFVYLYDPGKYYSGFLFDAKGVLTAIRVYTKGKTPGQ